MLKQVFQLKSIIISTGSSLGQDLLLIKAKNENIFLQDGSHSIIMRYYDRY